MTKMGAKGTPKIRYRAAAYKCDLCGRKLMSLDALKSHQRSIHNLQPEKIKTKQYVANKVKKAVVKPKLAKTEATVPISAPAAVSTTANKLVDTKAIVESEGANLGPNTVEFACPKCFRPFRSYFTAIRHIQELHSVNKKGAKVPFNSPQMLQPERIELCSKCNRKVKSIQTHICGTPNTVDEGLMYLCLACNTTFTTKRNFYMHVTTTHADGVESLFFPTNIEFRKWMAEMETQTEAKYNEFDKYDTKSYYHCSHKLQKSADTVNMCPSMILIQEFCKGVQVHYYKLHCNHIVKNYMLLKKYKKYSITDFLKGTTSYFDLTDVKFDDNDMYVQFKTLMESIVVDAAKLNMNALKVLLGKALEMTSILTNYDEETDESVKISKVLTDNEITQALETSDKRKKLDEYNDFVKRSKKDETNPSPMILNSFSLANPVESTEKNDKTEQTDKQKPSIKVKDITELQKTDKNEQKLDQTPSSFNESYTEFLEKNNFLSNTNLKPKGNYKLRTKRTLDKTIQTNKSFILDTTKTNLNTSLPEQKNTPEAKSKTDITTEAFIYSPKIQKAKPNILSKSEKTPKTDKIKVLSNIKIDNNKIKPKDTKNPKTIKEKPKVDFEYEIKEREDDCNILILKI